MAPSPGPGRWVGRAEAWLSLQGAVSHGLNTGRSLTAVTASGCGGRHALRLIQSGTTFAEKRKGLGSEPKG